MSARAATLLAAPFALLAFALRVGETLWLQPLTWRVHPLDAGLLAQLGLLASCVGIPLGAYVLLTKAARNRQATWELDADRRCFVAQTSPYGTGPKAIVLGWFAGGVVPIDRVPNQEHMQIAQLGTLTTISVALAAVLLIVVGVRLLVRRPHLSLDAEGITLQQLRNPVHIRWAELLPGGPPPPAKRNPRYLVLYAVNTLPGGAPQPRKLPAGDLHVDTAFLAHTIRCYVHNPNRRSGIGTIEELAALQL